MLKKTQHRELSVMGTLKLINGGGGIVLFSKRL